MNKYGVTVALRSGLIALAWLAAGPATAADAPTAPTPRPASQAQQRDVDLGEVLVEGRRANEKRPGFKLYQSTFDWLARLVGVFVIDGTADVHAMGNSEDIRKVSGRAECVGFGAAPGVQCELKIRWPSVTGPNGEEIPGGVTNLNPSAMLFGLEPVRSGISHILLDSKGVAETSAGEMLTADTMRSRAKCGPILGDCVRVTKITAWPDLKTIDMEMDLEINLKTAASFKFVMHRVPGVPSVVYGRKQEKEKKKK